MNKALFLDRDGIVNVDNEHLYRIEDVEFIPGIFDLCRCFQDKCYLIFIITNQAGIPKGLYTEQDFAHLMKWIIQQFKDEGVEISKVYHCSHHPDFTGSCKCRKPEPGMFLEAKVEFDLDMEHSINLGDKASDIEAGRSAGIKQNVLLRNNLYSGGEDACDSIINKLEELKRIL